VLGKYTPTNLRATQMSIEWNAEISPRVSTSDNLSQISGALRARSKAMHY
jgi:hypothetical protein